jgi:RES domain-containing protein
MDAKVHAATWNGGKGAELSGGRWNPRGFAAVYMSVDPATAVLEVAVHKGFKVLDTLPHVVSCARVLDPLDVHVLDLSTVPNANWLRPAIPGHGQQKFGAQLMEQYPFVAIPSVVLPLSWNIIFSPKTAAGKYETVSQSDFALDTRLHPPHA